MVATELEEATAVTVGGVAGLGVGVFRVSGSGVPAGVATFVLFGREEGPSPVFSPLGSEKVGIVLDLLLSKTLLRRVSSFAVRVKIETGLALRGIAGITTLLLLDVVLSVLSVLGVVSARPLAFKLASSLPLARRSSTSRRTSCALKLTA